MNRFENIDLGLGFLPVVFMACSCLTILVTYMISISNKHVYQYFPTISDTGGQKPEANIFSLFLSISSFLGLVIVIVRYNQFHFVSSGIRQKKLYYCNVFGLVFGTVISIGAGLVASYQNRGSSLTGHILGAIGVFGGGTIYSWTQTYLTYQMFRHSLNSRRLILFRVFLSSISTVLIVVFAILFYIANRLNHNNDKWSPSTHGFDYHVSSSVCEWLLALSLLLYFVSFTKEFNKISISLQVQNQPSGIPPFQVESMTDDDDEMLPA